MCDGQGGDGLDLLLPGVDAARTEHGLAAHHQQLQLSDLIPTLEQGSWFLLVANSSSMEALKRRAEVEVWVAGRGDENLEPEWASAYLI